MPQRSREENALAFGYRVNKLLIGNKADLFSKKIVSIDEGKAIAEECGMQFIETSAKLGDNVSCAFHSIALDIKQRFTIEGFGRYSLGNETTFVVKVVEGTLDTSALFADRFKRTAILHNSHDGRDEKGEHPFDTQGGVLTKLPVPKQIASCGTMRSDMLCEATNHVDLVSINRSARGLTEPVVRAVNNPVDACSGGTGE